MIDLTSDLDLALGREERKQATINAAVTCMICGLAGVHVHNEEADG